MFTPLTFVGPKNELYRLVIYQVLLHFAKKDTYLLLIAARNYVPVFPQSEFHFTLRALFFHQFTKVYCTRTRILGTYPCRPLGPKARVSLSTV
jgi:hypothetical protein